MSFSLSDTGMLDSSPWQDDGERIPQGMQFFSTPGDVLAHHLTTPPPLIDPNLNTRSPLLRALQKNAVREVRTLLESTPGMAKEPFWDNAFEPPLCAAVRLKCSIEVIELLLAHGADPRTTNTMRHKPIELVRPRVEPNPPPDVFPDLQDPSFPVWWMNEMTLGPVPWASDMPTEVDTWHDEVVELLKAWEANTSG